MQVKYLECVPKYNVFPPTTEHTASTEPAGGLNVTAHVQHTCSRGTLPDASGVGPVSGHKGTCQQRRDGLVKQEVVLKVGGGTVTQTQVENRGR